MNLTLASIQISPSQNLLEWTWHNKITRAISIHAAMTFDLACASFSFVLAPTASNIVVVTALTTALKWSTVALIVTGARAPVSWSRFDQKQAKQCLGTTRRNNS